MNFSKEDKEKIFKLASKITGTQQDNKSQLEILPINVWKRMQSMQIPDKELDLYLEFAVSDEIEKKELISALTIHTTSWFREKEHYPLLKKIVQHHLENHPQQVFSLWSAACSTGEEVYSLALVLENMKLIYPQLKYKILGSDIDPVSVRHAQNAIYKRESIVEIPAEYQRYFLHGSGKTEGLVAISKELRNNCQFTASNLLTPSIAAQKFHLIFCRNVLIYFDLESQKRIIHNFIPYLQEEGSIIIGLCEDLMFPTLQLQKGEKSRYQLISKINKIGYELPKVLFIEDEPHIIECYKSLLVENNKYKSFFCETTEEATQILNQENISLICLDLNLKGISGEKWLEKIREERGIPPVMVISGHGEDLNYSLSNLMKNGVIDIIDKTSIFQQLDLVKQKIIHSLNLKKANTSQESVETSRAKKEDIKIEHLNFKAQLIAIGASTGGTEALQQLLINLPKDCPPVVIVQHISAKFATPFAQRMAQVSGLTLEKFNQNYCPLLPGKLYMALDDYHLQIKKHQGVYTVYKTTNVMEQTVHRPSVDVLFNSIALSELKTLACILTGMGNDGAQGLFQIKSTGRSITLAQDKESCVVYGMPAEAEKLGAVHYRGNLPSLRKLINKFSHS